MRFYHDITKRRAVSSILENPGQFPVRKAAHTQTARAAFRTNVLTVDDIGGSILQHNVVAAALNDGGRGNHGQLCFLLQLRDGQSTAVAHGALDLVQSGLHTVSQRAGIGT